MLSIRASKSESQLVTRGLAIARILDCLLDLFK